MVEEQIVVLWAVINGYLDETPIEKIKEFEPEYIQALKLKDKKLLAEIADKKQLTDEIVKRLEKFTTNFLKTFSK